MRCRSAVVAIAAMVRISIPTMAQDANQGIKPELITFKSGGLTLKGFIWKPEGSGPFPAILWNHGSEKRPGPVDTIAPYFVSRGYIFLVPHRRGQGRSPGAYIVDQLNAATSPAQRSQLLVALNETHFQDQLAALSYLRTVPYVDKNRLVDGSFLRRHSDHVGRRTQVRLPRRCQLLRCGSNLAWITGFACPSDGCRQ